MSTSAPVDYQWETLPETARFVNNCITDFLQSHSWLREFESRLHSDTGTRLLDWVAQITLPENLLPDIRNVGYAPSEAHSTLWTHPRGLFPNIQLSAEGKQQLYLMVESVADFVLAQRLMGEVTIEGEPLAAVRRLRLPGGESCEVWAVERHGTRSCDVRDDRPVPPMHLLKHCEAFRLRRRRFDNEAEGFDYARQLIQAAIDDLGVDRTCDLFFAAEREYWQSRNRAARIQKARQDSLGLGWANHDHHTYRSSREHFNQLICVLEQLGFETRERFYAGREAGWGAQVFEQPRAGIVIFADVDLSAEEVTGDFAHEPLTSRHELGTVGLWCRLHGEAFLQAGLHHLECRFAFDTVREQLKTLGVESMKPFTDFSYLRQAFTQGEIWPVEPERIRALEREGRITPNQAARFRESGAIGSHLEVLERNDGYKGFNQTGINEIILNTDPRRQG